MRMFATIAAFEFRTRLSRISTWVYFAIFGAVAMFWTAAAGGAITQAHVTFGSAKIWIDSPYAIAQMYAFLGMFALTVIAAVMGRAVQQDFEHRTEAFFFTSPIGKADYLGGRFVAATGVLIVVLSSIPIGSALALLLPGIDPDRVGPVRPIAYLLPYATTLVPNLVVLGGFFFCLAALTRRMLPVYVVSIVLLVGYLAAQGLLRDMDNKTLAVMIDPFGVTAASRLTEYWPISERNTRLVPLAGYLLWNRLLWLAIGALVIGACVHRFRFSEPASAPRRARDAADDVLAAPVAASIGRGPTTATVRVRALALLPRMVWLNFRETVKNVYFAVIALAGVLFCITVSTTSGSIYGTNTWPVTYQMLELVSGTFSVFMLVIVTFYAGELAWRERDARLDQIHDALPIPTWLPFIAKLLALMLVPVVLQAVLMATGIGIQTAGGYHHYELGLYFKWLFGVQLVDYWLVCVLALAVHSIVNQKYLGHFVMIVYFIVVSFASLLGFEHNLYKYASTGDFTYSDMNGFGPFLIRVRFFQAYWAAAALLLALAAYLFWPRGTNVGWRNRMLIVRRRFTPRAAAFGAICACAMIVLGGFIFYNTNVLNHYVTAYDMQARQATYEKRYKSLASAAQPKITAVNVAVDLYPSEQRVRMKGHYTLDNRTMKPIDTIHLSFLRGDDLVIHVLDFGAPATLLNDDMKIGMRSYKLAKPLSPGDKVDLAFDLELPTRGFRNSGATTEIVANGSFINGNAVLPYIGYQEQGELVSDSDRKKFGLAPKERMRTRDDPVGLAENGISNSADFIAFEATISTDAGQYAIAPGYLQREWSEGGRRYFTYRMDAPILDFFAFQSARYAIKKDRWNDVAIEVYYQPGHEYNLERMIAATKAGLDYFTAHFGPYQYRQFRIIEFPRYATFAQSFPNTVPYSEGIGFIARVRDNDPEDIDYPYYVTAHELAHQWWGHQVPGANVQGNTMLVETLAQYSALMVMKKKYGEAKMQRFLRYELDRYLVGRTTEQKKELPLARVENQDYIHYRKGSLIMYALADYIGEDNLDRALRAYRDKWAFKGPPYSTTKDLLAEIRAVTPPKYAYVIDDFFDAITLYDNRAVSATAKALPDGRYEVTLDVAAKKVTADDLGKETDAPLHDYIDIGVLDDQGEPLFLEKRKIVDPRMTFKVIVAKKPARAGIDPYNELIDRRPKDNTVAVSIE
ncbi:MAG TPA: M1 family aminopeptidase, partial [Casimicrobiaceae bacterium]|nr:M1 family aminopeptidase [Casimicrobiaceae bacterium]